MCLRASLAVVEDDAFRSGILEQHTKHLGGNRRRTDVAHRRCNAARVRARLHHPDRLRMATRVDEESVLRVAPLCLVRHEHGLGSRGTFVEQGGIGDLQAGEVDHHGLVVEERLEPPLGDLGLIRCIGRVPAGILQDIALDHRRRERIVVAVAQIRAEDPVLHRDGAQRRKRLVLGSAGVDGERLPVADRLRNRRVDEVIEGRISECTEHVGYVGRAGSDMAWNERIGGR